MSRQSDKNNTFQIRIDRFWWKILSQLKTNTGDTFKSLVEGALAEVYSEEVAKILGESQND